MPERIRGFFSALRCLHMSVLFLLFAQAFAPCAWAAYVAVGVGHNTLLLSHGKQSTQVQQYPGEPAYLQAERIIIEEYMQAKDTKSSDSKTATKAAPKQAKTKKVLRAERIHDIATRCEHESLNVEGQLERDLCTEVENHLRYGLPISDEMLGVVSTPHLMTRRKR